MQFTLREYRSEDFDRLHAIDQECFPPRIAYSRRELAYYMKLQGAFTLVAEDETGKIAGFIIAQRLPRGMGHVLTIDTLKAHRRRGLGTLLMGAVEGRLQAAGCHAVALETAVDNAAAIAFYQGLGYFVLKTLPGYYPNNMDALLMGKRFRPATTGDASHKQR